LKGTNLGTIPARFGLIWFSGFRGEDLNVIFYQNMPNLVSSINKTDQHDIAEILFIIMPFMLLFVFVAKGIVKIYAAS
jgi:hypothetical protein